MRVRMSLLVWIHLVVAAFGQNYYPRKDAAFGQIAVGGEIETVINLTNRGTFAYTGTVRFFRGKGNVWNPLVNGNTISKGTYPLEIQPKSTATLRITGNQLESGAAVVISEDLFLDNFIEANLTYFVPLGNVRCGQCRRLSLKGILSCFRSLPESQYHRPGIGQRRSERRACGPRPSPSLH